MAEVRRAALWSPEALDDRERIWDYYARAAGIMLIPQMSGIATPCLGMTN